MSRYSAFNSLMFEFIDELIETFPEEKELKVFKNAALSLKKANHKKLVETFMAEVSQYSDQIMNKDENFILNTNNEFLKKINLCKWWTDDLSSNTKDAIWQYMNTLIMLGTTITTIPHDILTQIEGIADQCASSGKSPDISSLFSSIQGMLKQ